MVVSAGSSVLRMHYCSPSPSSSAGARSSDGGEALLAEAPRLLVSRLGEAPRLLVVGRVGE